MLAQVYQKPTRERGLRMVAALASQRTPRMGRVPNQVEQTGMAKRIKGVLKLQLPAGKATPAYPVGPALGPYGVNIMAFVKEYNERTASQTGTIVPVELTIYEDRSFALRILAPTAAALLRQAARVEKGSGTPGHAAGGQITRTQLREIAQIKLTDLNTRDLERAERMIAGTARSMGISVIEEELNGHKRS
jgi:large subunit ribosomal protein L11